MKILIAATPLVGHVNPLLAVGRLAAARGDEVLVLTDGAFRPRVEAAGLRMVAYEDRGAAAYLEPDLPPGPERWRHEFERRFIDPMPMQAAALRALIDAEAPDAVVAGSMFLGVLPLLLGDAPRPPILTLNVSFLFLDRPDGAPVGFGLPPARDGADRARYAALRAGLDATFVGPVRACADRRLARMGARPLPASLPHSVAVLPDLFLQPTVPAFEYDYGALPRGVRFIGLFQPPGAPAPEPAWWPELERANAAGKPVVLVTQGTLANADLSALVGPALTALADRDDLLVLATTGGRPPEALLETLGGALPANARVASYLPFRDLLPRVSLLVTNGGYGSVNQALAAGVPIVSAGLTEDKAEVGARIGWSGVGLDLATDRPGVEALRSAAARGEDAGRVRRTGRGEPHPRRPRRSRRHRLGRRRSGPAGAVGVMADSSSPSSPPRRLRVVVDLNRCQGYAQCCYAAPEAFALRGREILFYDPVPPAERRGEIERAVQACPVRAISLQAGPDDGDPA